MKLDTKQIAPLTRAERETLQELAKNSGITPGLFARALILFGLARMDDPALQDALTDAKEAAAQRLSDGAREAVHSRWGVK